MNARRFIAKTSRDALAAVRHAFGEDAVVLSTKPNSEGVEVLAMGGDSVLQIEKLAAGAPLTRQPPMEPRPSMLPRDAAMSAKPSATASPADDADQLAMSTLSFQDYVRDRMLKRRQEALQGETPTRPMHAPSAPAAPLAAPAAPRGAVEQRMAAVEAPASTRPSAAAPIVMPPASDAATLASLAASRREQEAMMVELRQVKGLIEERFGALAFMEKLQRQPGQALMTGKLLDAGFSPALVRKLADGLPAEADDPVAWATMVLERNLITDGEAPLEDSSGVFALIGPTGVGKTTSTAKIAAAFAARHGASHLGLITLDAYRVGAHEQLRTYGRILGVPVHTAHDRASLDDLLDLLAAKRMVLIDTAGMAQRDQRTAELLEMLSHRSIRRLLVLNASSQGETIEDVVQAYRGSACAGALISKLDEAVKLAPALDAAIRHRLRIVGVANGQRVPEDWHRVSASALVQRALRAQGSAVHRLEPAEVSLVFAAQKRATAGAAYA